MLPLLIRPLVRVEQGFVEPIQPVIIDGKIVDIRVHGFENFTEPEKRFYLKALNLLMDCISSMELKRRLLGLTVREANGLTNLQAYNKVLSGFDARQKQLDGALDFFFSLYYEKSDGIGYTYIGKLGIYTNRYFVSRWMKDPYGHCSLSGHIFHEYLHSVGFKHKVHSTSLVYRWGYALRDLGKEIVDGKVLTPVPGLVALV